MVLMYERSQGLTKKKMSGPDFTVYGVTSKQMVTVM